MKTQTKLAFMLIVTLLIGMVLGFIGHGIFFRDQFKRRAERMRTPEGFMQRFERVIQPTDSQRVEIRKILQSHFQQMMQQQAAFREDMDSFRKDLDSVLTADQRKRLQESLMRDRSKQFGKRSRHDHPAEPGERPPSGGPPSRPSGRYHGGEPMPDSLRQ